MRTEKQKEKECRYRGNKKERKIGGKRGGKRNRGRREGVGENEKGKDKNNKSCPVTEIRISGRQELCAVTLWNYLWSCTLPELTLAASFSPISLAHLLSCFPASPHPPLCCIALKNLLCVPWAVEVNASRIESQVTAAHWQSTAMGTGLLKIEWQSVQCSRGCSESKQTRPSQPGRSSACWPWVGLEDLCGTGTLFVTQSLRHHTALSCSFPAVVHVMANTEACTHLKDRPRLPQVPHCSQCLPQELYRPYIELQTQALEVVWWQHLRGGLEKRERVCCLLPMATEDTPNL